MLWRGLRRLIYLLYGQTWFMASYLNHHWGWSDIGPAWPTHGLRMGDGTFPKDNRNAATKRKATEKSNMLGNQRLLFFSYHASIDTWRTQEGTKYVLKIRWHPCELSRYVSSQQSLQSSLCPDPTLPFTILPSSGDSRESLQGRSWGLARQRPVSLAASCHQLWNTIL